MEETGLPLFPKEPGTHVFKNIRQIHAVKNLTSQPWVTISDLIECGEAFLEKQVFRFLFLNQRAGQEGADLSGAWRLRFQLRTVILDLSILAKPGGGPGPQPPSPAHMLCTWPTTLPVYKLPPFSAWFSSNCSPSPVM